MGKHGWEEKEKIEVPLYREITESEEEAPEQPEEAMNETPQGAPEEPAGEAPAGPDAEPAEAPQPEAPAEEPVEAPAEPAAAEPAAAAGAAVPAAPVQAPAAPVEQKRRGGFWPLAAVISCALILTTALIACFVVTQKLAELNRLNEELAVLEYRLALLEGSGRETPTDSTAPLESPAEGNGKFVATGDDVEMVCQALQEYIGLRGSEIVGIMNYQCPFDDYMMDAILIRVQVYEFSTMAAVNCGGYILIDRTDGTVLDFRDIVYPEAGTPVANSYEEARDILYWAFSCRPPEVAWNDPVWSEMETRRTWTQEELDMVTATLAD